MMSHKSTPDTPHKKHWYAATLIFRLRVEDQPEPYSCDEQVRLISARSPEKAYKKVYKLGTDQNTYHLNDAGEMVSLEFVGLANLTLIDSALTDGIKITSRQFVHSAPHMLALTQDELPIFAKPPQGQWHIKTDESPIKTSSD